MRTERFSTWRRPRLPKGWLRLAAALLVAGAAAAEAPEWLRAAARLPLPSYPEETDAVVLLEEQVTTVKDTGEVKTVYRQAYKILRPEGREHATFTSYYDEETRLTFLKGWSITALGEFEVKEKDAVETGLSGYALYSDNRTKILSVPAGDPGAVVGYEYEQKRRPQILQDMWIFQGTEPVRRARLVLELPKGWEFQQSWINHPERPPRQIGENEWSWELEDVAAIPMEPSMPAWRALAGRVAVTFFPRGESPGEKSLGSWNDVARWYGRLAAASTQASPEIRAQAAELAAGAAAPLDRLKALAAFVQRQVRYVAIEIGIGGYKPHAAQAVFSNRFGDCKDKVALLIALLQEAGLESHFVLVHSQRGAVARQFPSMLNFNHAIAAIRLPETFSDQRWSAGAVHVRLGRLLFFDPTDPTTPLGELPAGLQATSGLLVAEDGGELMELPVSRPSENRLLRSGTFQLDPVGALSGATTEVRWGRPAAERRSALLGAQAAERQKLLESMFAPVMGSFRLHSARAANLESPDQSLSLTYEMAAEHYGQLTGDLLLFRPRVMGSKGDRIEEEDKPRKLPFAFPVPTHQSDVYEFTLPGGFRVDELPAPVEVNFDFAEYRSATIVEGGQVRYTRHYIVKKVEVPVERLEDLRKLMRSIAADERSYVVLKRAAP